MPDEPRPKITAVAMPAELIEAGEKLMQKLASEPRPLTPEREAALRSYLVSTANCNCISCQILSALDHERQQHEATLAELARTREACICEHCERWDEGDELPPCVVCLECLNDSVTRHEQNIARVTAERDTFQTILEATMKERDLLAWLLEQCLVGENEVRLPSGKFLGGDGNYWYVQDDERTYPTALDAIRAAMKETPCPKE